jgi:hypothetical protein
MRKADCDEIWASNRHTPREALEAGIRLSFGGCWTLENAGVPVAMFGVAPSQEKSVGVVWLLATDQLNDVKQTFLRLSKHCIKMMLELFPVMFNFVDDRNTSSIRWLEWCGAEFSSAVAVGPDSLPFKPFIIRRCLYV